MSRSLILSLALGLLLPAIGRAEDSYFLYSGVSPLMTTVAKYDPQTRRLELHYVSLLPEREVFGHIPAVKERLDKLSAHKPGGDEGMVGSYCQIGVAMDLYFVMTAKKELLKMTDAIERLKPGTVVLYISDDSEIKQRFLNCLRDDTLIVMKKPKTDEAGVCKVVLTPTIPLNPGVGKAAKPTTGTSEPLAVTFKPGAVTTEPAKTPIAGTQATSSGVRKRGLFGGRR